MAGFSFEDISKVNGGEEDVLKKVIADAWATMKKTNWDDTNFCKINPKVSIPYPVAKNFQTFFESEGWKVKLKRENRNYLFDVYKD
jgi:hypothetical protein